MKKGQKESNERFLKKIKRDLLDKFPVEALYTTENLYGLRPDEFDVKADNNGIFHLAAI